MVADGVGGWATRGIDPGLFSKSLVADIKNNFDPNQAQELKKVLVESVKQNRATGSSTCVLAKFDTQRPNFIKTTNLGDSGYVLYRPDSNGGLNQLFRSKEQQHSFNFPYQCGTGAELPYAAFDTEHEVQDNDIMIMFSDGVSDNLFEEDVARCVKPHLKDAKLADAQAAADCLSQTAFKLGNDKNYASPFYKGAVAVGRPFPKMGKLDDIIVIAATIHTREKELEEF